MGHTFPSVSSKTKSKSKIVKRVSINTHSCSVTSSGSRSRWPHWKSNLDLLNGFRKFLKPQACFIDWREILCTGRVAKWRGGRTVLFPQTDFTRIEIRCFTGTIKLSWILEYAVLSPELSCTLFFWSYWSVDLGQDTECWRAVVNAALTLRVP